MKLIFIKVILILGIVSTILAAPLIDDSHSNSNETDSHSDEQDQFTPTTKKPLKVWFEEFNKNIEAAPVRSGISKFSINTDKNCVEQKIKMSENGNKIMNFAQAVVSVGIGYLKCYGRTENAAISEAINDFLKLYEDTNFDKYGDCYLNTLKKLEPTSKLVEHFDADQMELTKLECDEHLGENSYDDWMRNLEEYTGNLETFTCGNFKTIDFKITGMKFVILSHEKNEELKESEVEKLREIVGIKLNNIFECVIENL